MADGAQLLDDPLRIVERQVVARGRMLGVHDAPWAPLHAPALLNSSSGAAGGCGGSRWRADGSLIERSTESEWVPMV